MDWDGFKHEKNQLLKLQKQLNKKDYIEIQYATKFGYGRVYPKHKNVSLGTLRRKIRHTLCKDLYIDLDIVNAQPTIYVGILSKASIDCRYLKKYVNHRETTLKSIIKYFNCSREQAKELIITFINNGTMKSWMSKNQIEKFHDDETNKTYIYLKELKNEIERNNNLIISVNKDNIDVMKKYYKNEKKEAIFVRYPCDSGEVHFPEVGQDVWCATLSSTGREDLTYIRPYRTDTGEVVRNVRGVSSD
jgi:hypothetical protein